MTLYFVTLLHIQNRQQMSVVEVHREAANQRKDDKIVSSAQVAMGIMGELLTTYQPVVRLYIIEKYTDMLLARK